MIYRGFEIFAEVRVYEQWHLDDAGNQESTTDHGYDAELAGYWSEIDDVACDVSTIEEVKAKIDDHLETVKGVI